MKTTDMVSDAAEQLKIARQHIRRACDLLELELHKLQSYDTMGKPMPGTEPLRAALKELYQA